MGRIIASAYRSPSDRPACGERTPVRRNSCGQPFDDAANRPIFAAEIAVNGSPMLSYLWQDPDWPEFRWDAARGIG